MGGNGIPYGNAFSGYPDNSIRTSILLEASRGWKFNGKIITELRYPISENPVIYIMAFGELGNVWNTSD